jgi:hypothetical protein
MLCPVLIDRSAELEALTAAIDDAGHGHGSATFVIGDPGHARQDRSHCQPAEQQEMRVL